MTPALVQLGRPSRAPKAMVTVTVNGRKVEVSEGTTLLGAAAAIGVTVPTLCWLETLTPVNACRLCVVEVKGARVLAPACARAVEAGMEIETDSPRVHLTRKVVLELLASSVDLSCAPELVALMDAYGARPEGSTSKLSTLQDGRRVLVTLFRLYKDYRPLAFFGIPGGLLLAARPIGPAPLRNGTHGQQHRTKVHPVTLAVPLDPP